MKDKQILALSHQLTEKKGSLPVQNVEYFFLQVLAQFCVQVDPPFLYLHYHSIMSKLKRKWDSVHLLEYSGGPFLLAINTFCSCLMLLGATGDRDCCEDENAGNLVCQHYVNVIWFCFIQLPCLVYYKKRMSAKY